ncbi:MAG TPA: transposase [Bryobacteraceae bacterium]|nr:transposase [Bryobacteraceae bacterium]
MARMARVIAEGVAHHITQRGNARRVVFTSDTDRLVYLGLLRQYSTLHRCPLVGYCLMSNHVHLIAVPGRADSLPRTLRDTHGRYAAYLNGRQGATGHVWQGRYFSCPLEGTHLWAALRYVERNPLRAGMAARAEEYVWSSAAAHCGAPDVHRVLDTALWMAEWTAESWKRFLSDEADSDIEAMRNHTHTGRPLGSEAFVKQMERTLCRPLVPQKGGRPRGQIRRAKQELLDFAVVE